MNGKGRQRSAIWKYYSKISDTVARCKLCSSTYSLASGVTGNLHKHLRVKHKRDYKRAGVQRNLNSTDDSDSDLVENDIKPTPKHKRPKNDIDIEEYDVELPGTTAISEENESTSHRVSGAALWNYFVKVSNAEARCNLCHTIYSYKGGSTSNLKRHLKNKHPNLTSKPDVTDECDTDPLADAKPVVEEILVEFEKEDSFRNFSTNKTKPRTSTVWEHFTQLSKEEVKCNTCQLVCSFRGRSTSNLHRHLRKHKVKKGKPSEIVNYLNNFYLENEPSTDESEPDSIEATTTIVPPIEANNSSQVLNSHCLSKPKFRKVNDLLLNFVVRDLQSFSTLRGEGFSQLVEGLEPSYKRPNDSVLTSLLMERYEHATSVLKKLLAEATDVTITTDCWTSFDNRNYLAMSAHFITKKWELLSCFLDCVTYEEHDSEINVSKKLDRIATDWGISEKVHIAVTDNAPNVVRAVQLNQWPHLHCFAHTLNLIIQRALSTFADIHKKVGAIVEYFQQNPEANAAFLNTQKQLDSECVPVKLKNDDPAVWNTSLCMFERLIKLEKALTLTVGVLNDPPHLLNENESKTLNEIYRILSPFQQLADEMVAEQSISISKIIVVVEGLTSLLNEFSGEVETETAALLIKSLQDSIGELLPSVEYDSYLAKASLLDPRFSRLAFKSDDAFKVAKADLEAEARMRVPERVNKYDQNFDTKHNSGKESSIWQVFDRSIKSSIQTSPEEIANAELRLYLEEPLIDRKTKSLLWWKNKSDLYPTLSLLARKHLCAVGSSANCKMIFSQTGRIFIERRSRLEDRFISKILFLHFNDFLSTM